MGTLVNAPDGNSLLWENRVSPRQVVVTNNNSHANYEGYVFSDTNTILGTTPANTTWKSRMIKIIGDGNLKYQDGLANVHLIPVLDGDIFPIQTNFIYATVTTCTGVILFE